jgi:Ring hydroxylating alpha subunit (catalytic domain)
VRHRCPANWKMLPENDSDGYHLGFVHAALFRSVRTQYQRVVGDERAIKAVIRDWGHGHIEIDWSPGYQAPFEWLGNASGPAVDEYVAVLERRDGPEMTRRRIVQGPAHALIFPNLFLGETNIAIVEPVDVEACVHWHTPMFLSGVPRFNDRLLRMAEAGMGPASFLMPDDLIVAARNQVGLRARDRVAAAASRPQPRVRRRRGARRVPRHRRDDQSRALASLPRRDDRDPVTLGQAGDGGGRVARPRSRRHGSPVAASSLRTGRARALHSPQGVRPRSSRIPERARRRPGRPAPAVTGLPGRH